MTTGEKIAKLRKEYGYSQERFSELLDISRQTVSKWENDTTQPTSENLGQIAELFGVTLSYLLDSSDTENNKITDEIYDDSHSIAEVPPREKLFTLRRITALMIASILIFQTFTIINMKKQIDSLWGTLNMVQTRVSSLSSVLDLYADNSDRKEPDAASFTDYSYHVVSYDHGTNIAAVEINVLPLGYSQTTDVKFALKTDKGMQMTDAYFENHVFTATVDILCDENIPLYMYLTDGDKVRSYLIDYLPDFSNDYKLKIHMPRVTGYYTLSTENGVLDVNNTTYYFMMYYKIMPNPDDCIYPEIAVIQTLCDGRVIYETAVEKILTTDYNRLAQEEPSYEPGSEFWGADNMYQRIKEYGDTKIKDRSIKADSQISFRLIVRDNHGIVYETEPVIVD